MFENLEMFIESARACFFYDEKTLVFFSITDWMSFWLLPFFVDEELAEFFFSNGSQDHLPNRYSFDSYFLNSSVAEILSNDGDVWLGYYVFGWLGESLDWFLVFCFLGICIWLTFNLLSRLGILSIVFLFGYFFISLLFWVLFGYFLNLTTFINPFLILSEKFNYTLINFVWFFSLPFTFFFGFLVSTIGLLDYSFVYKFPLYSPLDITDYPISTYVNMVGSPQIFGILRLHENLLSIISGITVFVLFLLTLCLFEYGFFSFNGFKTNSFFLSELIKGSIVIPSYNKFNGFVLPKTLNNVSFIVSSNPYIFRLNDDINEFTTGSYYDRSILNLPFLVKINNFLEKLVVDIFDLIRNVSSRTDFTESVSENVGSTAIVIDDSLKWRFFSFSKFSDKFFSFNFSNIIFEIFGCYVLFFKNLINYFVFIINCFSKFTKIVFVIFFNLFGGFRKIESELTNNLLGRKISHGGLTSIHWFESRWPELLYLKLFHETGRAFRHWTLLEIIWTIIPSLILLFIGFPSLALLYVMEETHEDYILTVKAIAHQWYWDYSYTDLFDSTFSSYMLDDLSDRLNYSISSKRLLLVDNPVVVPERTNIKWVITSSDVLHCFALPSLGFKMDAVPGRLNVAHLFILESGTFYGQCSELCGVNHGFMPIQLEVVSVGVFQEFYNSLMGFCPIKK